MYCRGEAPGLGLQGSRCVLLGGQPRRNINDIPLLGQPVTHEVAGSSPALQSFSNLKFCNVKRTEAMRSREGGCGKVQTNRIEICLQILDLHIGIRSHETCPNSPPKRVQDRYNLSVPSVLFRCFGSPTVPQNQRDIPTPQPVTHEVAGSSPVVPAKSFESDMLHSWTARLFYSPSGVPPR